MLILWTDPAQPDHTTERADDPGTLTKIINHTTERAAEAGTPLALQAYPGHHYPQPAHWEGTTHEPADPGDSPQPELLLTLGADVTPLYWTSPDGTEYASIGTDDDQPELEYLYGGQQTYAPASALIPASKALEALTEFTRTHGQRPHHITWQQT